MGLRIASTFALWSLVVVAITFARRDGAVAVLALFALASQHELYQMLEKIGHKPFRKLGVALGFLLIVAPYVARRTLGPDEREGLESALIAITIVACCLRVMRERTGSERLGTLISTIFGLVYVPFMLFFLVNIMWLGTREIEGLMLLVWALFAAKFCDAGALLTGSLIGRHKMAPSMSPAKTWEGAVGGVLFAAGMCAILVALARPLYPATFTPLKAALLALLPSTVSITADLIESVFKRAAGVKDSGRTIPGIGGAFDLTDSLILSAPVAYLLLRVFV